MSKRRNTKPFERLQNKLDYQHAIVQMYKSGKFLTRDIATTYGISSRSVQRLARKWGVARDHADACRVAAPLMPKHRVRVSDRLKHPKYLVAGRVPVTKQMRWEILAQHPYCEVCGASSSKGAELEIDHVDDNPLNTIPTNLQVLCRSCNLGKEHLRRYGSAFSRAAM